MEEKICGACAQKKKLDLDTRIKIAISRIPMVQYVCQECKRVHFTRF